MWYLRIRSIVNDFLNKIPGIAKNRYFLTGLLFVIWISFFDSYNFIYHGKLIQQKKELQKELNHLKLATRTNKSFIQKLQNPAFTEKYAREKFLLKKEGEDIFIIEQAQ